MSDLTLTSVVMDRGARRVLDGIDVSFAAGRLTAVIGPNGAGKSTLLHIAAGLLAPSAGTVMLGTETLASLSHRTLARRRAYLPQRAGVEWPISVERVVALGLTPTLPAFGGLPASMQASIAAALDRYDLADLRHRPATELSGGELARVMMARATVGEPEILIVDEPTAGLDPRHVLEAGQRLRALADAGCTVVAALHDLDLALRIADEAVAMKDGRVLARGRARDVFSDSVLADLYDVPVRVIRDADGGSVRFLG